MLHRHWVLAFPVLLLGILSGCGSPPPEPRGIEAPIPQAAQSRDEGPIEESLRRDSRGGEIFVFTTNPPAPGVSRPVEPGDDEADR
jgi:hypothetical protein